MAIEVKRKLFTVEEFQRMGESGVFDSDARLELLEGEILEMNAVGSRHVAVVNRLTRALVGRVGDRQIVSVQNPFVLDPRSQPQPDLLVLRAKDDDYYLALPGPEDVLLAIEVSDSTLRHDTRKAVLYAREGVPEAWLVVLRGGPDTMTIRVFTDPTLDGYRQIRTLRHSGTLEPTSFECEPIPVREILKAPLPYLDDDA